MSMSSERFINFTEQYTVSRADEILLYKNRRDSNGRLLRKGL